MPDLIEHTGQETIVYQGKIIEVVEQSVQIGNRQRTFEIARRTPGVRLIVLSHDKQQILLSKEHRHEHSSWDYRLPGGKVFDTLNEYNTHLQTKTDILPAVEAAVRREAKEEVGIEVVQMKHFVTTKAGSTIEWDLWYFVIEAFEQLPSAELGEGENIVPEWVDLSRAQEFALNGSMQEDRSVAVLLKYLHLHR